MFDWLWCGVIILALSVISYYQTDREKACRSPCLMLLYVWFYRCDVLLHNEAESEVGGRSEPRVAFKGWIYCPAQRAGPITF